MKGYVKLIYLNILTETHKTYYFKTDDSIYYYNYKADRYRGYLGEVVVFMKKYATKDVKNFYFNKNE